MAENETPADQVRSMMTKNLEQANEAIANYFQLVEKSISASPLGGLHRLTRRAGHTLNPPT